MTLSEFLKQLSSDLQADIADDEPLTIVDGEHIIDIVEQIITDNSRELLEK